MQSENNSARKFSNTPIYQVCEHLVKVVEINIQLGTLYFRWLRPDLEIYQVTFKINLTVFAETDAKENQTYIPTNQEMS